MFDLTNLPLSPLKPIKKTIGRTGGNLIQFLLPIIVAIGFFLINRAKYSALYNTTSVVGQIWDSSIINWVIYITIILVLLILGCIYLYEYLYYKSYYYSFGAEGGEVKKGVFSRATGHVRYDKLQNVYVDQDFLDRIFGLYDVHYETAGETSGFYSHVDGLNKENSDKLVSFLNKETGSASNDKKKDQDKKDEKPVAHDIKTKESSNNLGKVLISRKDCPISQDIIKARVWTIIVVLLIPAIFLTLEGVGNLLSTSPSEADSSFASFLIVFLTVYILLIIGTYYYYKEWFKNFNYTFGQDKAEIFTKVIGQSSSYLYYDRIQNVMVNQMIMDRIFGLYTLVIETAGDSSGRALRIEGFEQENAEKVKDFLIEKSRKYRKNL